MSARSISAYADYLERRGGALPPRVQADEMMADAIKLLDKAARIIAQADEIAASARALGATPVLLSHYSARRAKGECP